MARGAFWGVAVCGLMVLAGSPLAVTRADDEGGDKLSRAFRMSWGGPRLGVSLADLSGDDRTRLKVGDERGALVKEVEDGSPADKAGLKADDVIVRFDGEAVRSSAQLSRLVRETPPGRTVPIEVNRGGATQRLTATLEEARGFGRLGDLEDLHVEMPPVPPLPAMPPVPPIEPLLRERFDRPQWNLFVDRPARLGIRYQELTDQLARHFNVEKGSLLVSHVDADSPAAKAGLKAGDIIVKVDGKAVSRGQDLRERVASADSGAQITLGVLRDGTPVDVTVTLPTRERSRARREPTI